MSIRSATLALAPDLYWPLDDADLIARDASGHSRNGAYAVGFVPRVNGPEIGTFAAGNATANTRVSLTTFYASAGPLSFSTWFTAVQYNSTTYGLHYNGNGSANGTGQIMAGDVIEHENGGLGIGSSGYAVTHTYWHNFVLTYAASGVEQQWIDGVLRESHNAGAYHPAGAGDPLFVGWPQPGIIAHFAFWQRPLSNAEVPTIWAGRVGPQESLLSGAAVTDFSMNALSLQVAACCTDQSATLAQILAAVRGTF